MKGIGLWTLLLIYLQGVTEVTLDQIESSSPSLLKKLTAVCGKDGIKVIVKFYHPFKGVAYSDGHFDTPKCVFINQENAPTTTKGRSNETKFTFLIPADECGTVFHDGKTTLAAVQGGKNDDETMLPSETSSAANEVYMENTVMFQKSHFIQEQGDLAQTLRCVWQKEIRRPLQATLPLMGKQRPKHSHQHSYYHPHQQQSQWLNKTQSNRDRYNYQYYTASYSLNSSDNPGQQQKGTELAKKRFQPKGHVESVPYYAGRSGKSINVDKYPEIANPHDESISFKSLYNLTALPFKAPASSGSISIFILNHFIGFSYCASLFIILNLFG